MGRRFRLTIFMAALAVMLVLPGAVPVADGSPLFPLRPGSLWVYASPSGSTHSAIVLGPNQGGPGFEIIGYFGGFFDLRILQGNRQDTVFEILPDGTEGLYYFLDAPVGTSWKMEVGGGFAPCIDGSTVTVGARDLTLTVPAGTFSGVVRLDHQSRCIDSGISAEWFAPGIGLIQRTRITLFGPITTSLVFVDNVPGVDEE